MPIKNPRHPEHSIKDACLNPLRLRVTEAADILGVARHTLSCVINADHWLRVQVAYDLAQARRRENDIRVKRYQPQPAA